MKIRLDQLESALEEAEKYPETTIKGKVARKIVNDAKTWLRNGMSIPVGRYPKLSAMLHQIADEANDTFIIRQIKK